MRAAERIGRRHVLSCGNTHLSASRRRVANKTILNSAAGIAAAGLMSCLSPQARANTSLFTTTSDWAGWTGHTDYNSQAVFTTVAVSTTYDTDGATINGAGNNPGNSGSSINVGGTSAAGSLQIMQTANNPQINYNAVADAPGEAYNQAFMSAIDPGSVAAYSAGSDSTGSGIITAYSGTLQYTYTIPTISSGSYFQTGILLQNDTSYNTYFSSSTTNDGTIDGLSTYTANIPYSFAASTNFHYLNFSVFYNSNYVPTSSYYVDNIQVVSVSTAGQSEWITNGNGAYESDANWSNGEPSSPGNSALFDTDAGAITVNPIVTLSSAVSIDSLTFNASSISYTIANGGAGNITTNSINVLAGTHTINAALTIKNGAVFNVSSGSSLTASNVVDGVGYYHNVAVVGGGSLTVNALSNAALDVNGTTLTTTAESDGEYVYLENGAVWNIKATSTIEQYYDDQSTTLNLASGVTLMTQDHTIQIGGTLTGAGNLALGAGPNGIDSADGYYAQLSGNNSNYSGAITITGAGTLNIANDGNLGNGSSTNTLNVSNGTLNITGAVVGTQGLIIGAGNGAITTNGNNMQVGSLSGPGTLSLSGGNTLTIAPQTASGHRTLALGGLNLNASNVVLGTASLQANRTLLVIGSGGLTLSGATNAWTSLLDLGGNDMIVQGGSLATILNQAKQGLSTGTAGIESSVAAADTTHLTALAIIQNSLNQSPGGTVLYSTFEGTASTSADVLLKYTYVGDANLDGKVDGSDYSRIDNSFLLEKTSGAISGWYNGDFNYDGVVNGSDYTLIDNAFNRQGAQLTGELATATAQVAGGSAVPEPTTLGLLIMSAAGLLGRRRERRHA